MTPTFLLLPLLACAPKPVARRQTAAGAAPERAPHVVLEFRCKGQEQWQPLEPRSRDCTGIYPMFPEGNIDASWCANLVGFIPDTPWRRAQAGTAEWRVMSDAGEVLAVADGPCLVTPDPGARVLLGTLNACSDGLTVGKLAARGCTATENSTLAATFLLDTSWARPIEMIQTVPPYLP